MHTPTIHNPTNFDPSQYEINGYFDNRPPYKIFGQSAKEYKLMQQQWEMEREELFPDHNDHRCEHCGQPNVRFVISCTHTPTNKNICFGDICVARLNFPNYDKFQAARLRAEAAAKAKEYKRGLERKLFLSTRPALRKAIARFNKTPEKFSPFARDIVAKFNQWGNMSERQEAAFIKSLDWKNSFEAEKERQRKTSRHVGTIGARIAFDNAEIKHTQPTRSSFGPGHFTVIEDCAGNSIICFAYLGEKGSKVSFTAKVKAHNERDGIKQTMVNYAKLNNEIPDKGSDACPDIDMLPF
jgi:hypothetical protein